MRKQAKQKKEKSVFVCQVSDRSIKLIKYSQVNKLKKSFNGIYFSELSSVSNDENIIENLRVGFKQLLFNNQPVIFSLPRTVITSRYLKVPTQSPQEIEKIINLQASRYLPYPASELITAYQIVSLEKGGFANINLVIAHKDVVERYLKILKNLKVQEFNITLSSTGLNNLYSFLNPPESIPVMLVDIDRYQIELSIIRENKLLFSRYFKIERAVENWREIFLDEVRKTKEAYFKEVGTNTEPKRIILTGAANLLDETQKFLQAKQQIPVELLNLGSKIDFSADFFKAKDFENNSFAGLIGLAIAQVSDTLSLLPQQVKQSFKEEKSKKENFRIWIFVLGLVVIWSFAIAKDINNKERYLKRVKTEIAKISGEAKSLEDVEKRLILLKERSHKRPTSLDVLYELHQIIPSDISLIGFNYDEANQVTLRGQTTQLNSVFELVNRLEKSEVFNKFNIKVRYATKRHTVSGEIVDFEIICSR